MRSHVKSDWRRKRLIEQHLPLVESIARRYQASGEPHEDLVQVGTIGLIKAIDRFDSGRGHKLSTVAVPAIEGEIRHHLRDGAPMVRMPRPVRELDTKLRAKEKQLSARLGREPTMAELAEAVGASDDAVAEAVASRATHASLDVESPSSAVSADGEEASDARLMLAPGWAALDERERQVLELRYHEDLSQTDIAQRMGISQATVSRLLRDALERLRASMGEEPAPDDDPPAPVAEAGKASYSPRVATQETETSDPRPTHSGKLMVRMPASLHAELAGVAEREGVSLNSLVTGALAGAVRWRDPQNPGDTLWHESDGEGAEGRRPTWLRTALIANLVVVALAAIAAIALLIAAWTSGW